VSTSINSPVLKLGDGVLQDGLQILIFDLVDMYRLSHKIEEVIEFQKLISVKKIMKKF
jgi:hypothetical protein